MHVRRQQGRRRFFIEAGLDPNRVTFGHTSISLVGGLGQLGPIDDGSMCDPEATFPRLPGEVVTPLEAPVARGGADRTLQGGRDADSCQPLEGGLLVDGILCAAV